MRDIAFAGTIKLPTLWMRARESGIRILHWRRLCHRGPLMVRNGPKDTEVTPVVPRYYSPGLPETTNVRNWNGYGSKRMAWGTPGRKCQSIHPPNQATCT